MKRYVIEFIGTFFLVLTVGLTGNPIAIGAVLATMVYMGGYISGAHYNPAVTFALLLQKKISGRHAGVYVLVQLLAGLAAAATFQLVEGHRFVVRPGMGVDFGVALLLEIIFTFALVSVVLHTAASAKTKGNDYYGLAIGAVLLVAAFAAGPISGGAFNPAVGLGPDIYNWGWLTNNISNFWLYIVGPLAGGALASAVFSFTTANEAGKAKANN